MRNPSPALAGTWQSDGFPAIHQSATPLRISFPRKMILWMVGAYLILNVGFEMVRIPPVGPGIPIGELVLVLCVFVISTRVLLPMMAREVWLLPILVWWGLSLSRSVMDFSSGGIWAFRDASQAIESLYLIVGFWLVSSEANLQYFFRWLRRMLFIAAGYGLLYPLSDKLQALSPKLSGLGSGATSLVFAMQNAAVMLIWAAAWLLIDRPPNARATITRDLLAGLLLAMGVAFGQSRSNYLQILVLGAVLFAVKRKTATKWAVTLLLGALLIGAISISGVELKGRENQRISLDFIAQHFESISGSSSGSENIQGATAGISLRIGWWRHILDQLESSPAKMAFGLGYGIPLTDFQGSTAITREPHNSYISVIGRLGVSGMLVWVLMQAALYTSWLRSFRLCKRMHWTSDQINLLILLIFCLLTLVESVGEAAMEVPFYAIPYYFFFGVMLRYGRHLRQAAAS
jgi:hypothetical protein